MNLPLLVQIAVLRGSARTVYCASGQRLGDRKCSGLNYQISIPMNPLLALFRAFGLLLALLRAFGLVGDRKCSGLNCPTLGPHPPLEYESHDTSFPALGSARRWYHDSSLNLTKGLKSCVKRAM